MSEHPIEGLMKTTMESIKQMIDVNTIVGNPVNTQDGGVIIPISKVSVGFASGGSEFNKSSEESQGNQNQQPGQNGQGGYPFGGGSGAGMSVQPVAFLVINKDHVKLLPVSQQNSIERLVDSAPDLIDNITSIFKKSSTEDTKNCCKGEEFNPS